MAASPSLLAANLSAEHGCSKEAARLAIVAARAYPPLAEK
jgi:hypothetical protein